MLVWHVGSWTPGGIWNVICMLVLDDELFKKTICISFSCFVMFLWYGFLLFIVIYLWLPNG